MRKITLLFLLFAVNTLFAQDDKKVWDLLLKNDRIEARKIFDKELAKNKEKDIELLILDAMIDVENGRINFDTTFLESFSKFEESKNLLYPLWRTPFVVGTTAASDFDELNYMRLDFIANSPLYENDPYVIASKAISDKKRLDYEGHAKNIQRLNAISQWQFCGVFENMNGSGHDTEYEPELYAKNDKMFNANSNGMVNWYVPFIQQKEGAHFYRNEAEYGSGVVYAQTFIENDADREVVLDFGSSGPLKIFINDIEVYSNDRIEYAELNAYHLKFNLKKGVNRLLLKSSISGNTDYFYAALRDTNGGSISSLKYSNEYKLYNTSSIGELNVHEIDPFFETYLINKVKEQPGDPLYQILLYHAYLNNGKEEKAFEAIEELSKKYPSSSMLNSMLIDYYSRTEDSQKAEELKQNIILKDEDYHFSIISKFQDTDWLKRADITELEKYKNKAKKVYSPLYADFYEYIILLRNSDIDASMVVMEKIIADTHYNEGLITTMSTMYASLKNDQKKTISMLEDLVSKRENEEAMNMLINYYNSNGRKEDAKRLINYKIEHYPYYNYVYFDAITIANGENNYDKSLKYAEAGLKNFPYSFRFLQQKGMVYNYLKDSKQAEKYLKKSLLHYSANTDLRKILYDLNKVPNELDQVSTKNVHNLIKERRQAEMKSDYGVVMLLDEMIVNVLPEGARRNRIIAIYEIVAESGIEELKEYNINGNRLNIVKAEIVKPNGSIVPGEQNYGTIVFTNLEVNDVVYVEYETTDNGYGRFYKDFTQKFYFNGSYPVLETIFGIISPEDVTYDYNFTNGDISHTKSKLGDKVFLKWQKKDVAAIMPMESYSPAYSDVVNAIQVSTIKSWGEIANWYSDLVKRSLKTDNVTVKTFNDIFPKGTEGFTQEEIAFKIYSYIGENITYSSLDFRQSGYVPQKPSKTISTKLGDCKDVSTLFVALAEKAGLKANLVLVQTNDNGVNLIELPQISFNHCIVKVNLDGKEHFLELTDKYLPFKALPLSLYNAKALVVSFDKAINEKVNIINIPFDNALTNSSKTTTIVSIQDNIKNYVHTQALIGSGKAYYNELFSESITEDYRKKDFEENLNQRTGKVVVLESAKLMSNERYSPEIIFETKFSVSEKLQSVGSLKIMEIPFLDKVYTRDVIANEKRNYDINYIEYENSKTYESEIILHIAEGQKFIEIPENKELMYKNHRYTITYEVVKPNSLKVLRKVNIPWDNIKPAEYADYKKYVEGVLEIEDQVIGFK